VGLLVCLRRPEEIEQRGFWGLVVAGWKECRARRRDCWRLKTKAGGSEGGAEERNAGRHDGASFRESWVWVQRKAVGAAVEKCGL